MGNLSLPRRDDARNLRSPSPRLPAEKSVADILLRSIPLYWRSRGIRIETEEKKKKKENSVRDVRSSFALAFTLLSWQFRL